MEILRLWRGIDEIIEMAKKYLREKHVYKDGPVDVFVEFYWAGRWQAALLEWNEQHGCWSGWLTDLEELNKPHQS
jgi:hypothetical protein